MSTLTSTTLTFGTTTRNFHFRAQSSDEKVIRQIFIDRHYELRRLKRAAELMDYAARQGAGGLRPLVVDAGANIGASAIHFVANVPAARVVAIEPDRANFELLSRNVEGLDVDAVNGALA